MPRSSTGSMSRLVHRQRLQLDVAARRPTTPGMRAQARCASAAVVGRAPPGRGTHTRACAVSDSSRSRSSLSKPFMTESTTISAATPSAHAHQRHPGDEGDEETCAGGRARSAGRRTVTAAGTCGRAFNHTTPDPDRVTEFAVASGDSAGVLVRRRCYSRAAARTRCGVAMKSHSRARPAALAACWPARARPKPSWSDDQVQRARPPASSARPAASTMAAVEAVRRAAEPPPGRGPAADHALGLPGFASSSSTTA